MQIPSVKPTYTPSRADGPCRVYLDVTDPKVRGPMPLLNWCETAPDMETALEEWDPFNATIHWPLRNVIPYLGRMGVA